MALVLVLRTVLLSTHIATAEAIVWSSASPDRINRLAHRELQRWVSSARACFTALNPHGAEGGLFGIEEALNDSSHRACHVSMI